MRKLATTKLIFIAVFTCVYALIAVAQVALTGRINDNAGLLSASEQNELENLLARFEAKSGNQVVVVTVKSLDGKNIEEFGYQLGRLWGIGSKEKNNGVLLIVAPNEREVRIEVGYGLEGILTDAHSKIIIERDILPYFRRGEMGEGLVQGVRAILAALGEGDAPAEKNKDKGLDWLTIFFFLAILLIFLLRLLGTGRGPRPPRSGGLFGGFGNSSGDREFKGDGGSFGGGGASGKW